MLNLVVVHIVQIILTDPRGPHPSLAQSEAVLVPPHDVVVPAEVVASLGLARVDFGTAKRATTPPGGVGVIGMFRVPLLGAPYDKLICPYLALSI